jgi:hypothetical protein
MTSAAPVAQAIASITRLDHRPKRADLDVVIMAESLLVDAVLSRINVKSPGPPVPNAACDDAA